MKECPRCHRCFDDEYQWCNQDGQPLFFSMVGSTDLEGRYKIEHRLGHGGMGVVYKAHHTFLRTHHAVKIILPELVGNDSTLSTRFRHEAILAASIHHQNVINVTDFGIAQGTVPFLVMEFLKGEPLAQMMKTEGRISPTKTMDLLGPICAGVGAAHKLGIIHRDLKPLNIMLKNDTPFSEGLKVLDFGLAKIISADLTSSMLQLQTMGFMGSPIYMSPEQWSENSEIDNRTDIYSIGIILYQMLSGTLPFQGSSIPSVMRGHLLETPPSFNSIGLPVSPLIEAVVLRALEKQPERRHQTTAELYEEFRHAMMAANKSKVINSFTSGDLTERLPQLDLKTTLSSEHFLSGEEQSAETRYPIDMSSQSSHPSQASLENQAEMQRLAHELSESQRRAEEESRKKQEEEALLRLKEESARRRAEEEARLRAEQEAQQLRNEVEKVKKRAEEEARLRAEEEARLRAELEAQRLAREVEEAKRLAREVEEAKKREEEEFRKLAEEEARKQAEKQARIKAEEEAKKLAEKQAKKLAEEEAKKLAQAEALKRSEEEARRRAEEEIARRQLAEEAHNKVADKAKHLEREVEKAKKLAEEEARLRAEEEARLRAELEAQRLAREVEEAKKREEEEFRKLAEEEARKQAEKQARIKAEEEARKLAEEEAKKLAEEEAKKLAKQEVERLKREIEEAKKLAQEEAKKRSSAMPQSSGMIKTTLKEKKKRLYILIITGVVLGLMIVFSAASYGIYLLVKPQNPPSNSNIDDDNPRPDIKNMVSISGGEFIMGTNDIDSNNDPDLPQYPAHIQFVDSFMIDITEVTNEEYAKFVEETKHQSPEGWNGQQPPIGKEKFPVVNVSIYDAEEFAKWRSKRDGLQCELPTEFEWEYVARSGSKGYRYPWGNDFKDNAENIGTKSLKPVGSYAEGTAVGGVQDMLGNAFEWTQSRGSSYPGSPYKEKLPVGYEDQNVIRGGTFSSDTKYPRLLTLRQFAKPSFTNESLSFRLVCKNR